MRKDTAVTTPYSPSPHSQWTVPAAVEGIAPGGRPLASSGDRFLARLIDVGIQFLITLVFLIPVIITIVIVVIDDDQALSAGEGIALLASYAAIFVLSFALSYVYEVELPRRTGQTVGKRVMKIRVAPVDATAVLTRRILVKRWLVYGIANGIVPLLILLDVLWQLWDQPLRQCLHDKFAETIVVKASP